MDRLFLVVMVFFATGLVGCSSSPAERKAEASAEISEEKAKMMKRYGACLEKFEVRKMFQKNAHLIKMRSKPSLVHPKGLLPTPAMRLFLKPVKKLIPKSVKSLL